MRAFGRGCTGGLGGKRAPVGGTVGRGVFGFTGPWLHSGTGLGIGVQGEV